MLNRTPGWIAVAAVATALAFAALPSPAEEPVDDESPDVGEKAIKAWGKTCRICHTVPDLRFETDRAFLRQITETT